MDISTHIVFNDEIVISLVLRNLDEKAGFFLRSELGSHYRDPKMGFIGINQDFWSYYTYFVWKI